MKLREVFNAFKRVFVKNTYKDILFRFVFREPEEILHLYNAVNQTHYTNPDDLVVTTMEDVIYIGMKNDMSFLIANEMNLYEHQSTLNRNMPLRGLLYLAKMYESYIETHKLNRYQKKMIQLPFPRFIVFYNGEEDIAEELYMRLSDAFVKKSEEPAVECVAKFININYGHNKDLMDKCRRLHDYSYFVACVRSYLRQGIDRHDAVVYATDECIEKGVLADILVKHRAEVIDMFLTTFDRKMYEEALREEGRDEVLEKYEKLVRENVELSKDNEELAKGNEELSRKCTEYINTQKAQAGILMENGISYEVARKIVPNLSEEELKAVYEKKQTK